MGKLNDSEADKKLLQKTAEFKAVSFDLFDTLLFRAVSKPEMIFDLVEFCYNQECEQSVRNFRRIRKAAEEKARKKAHYNEVNIWQIYEQLPFEKTQKAKLMEIEQRLEAETAAPNRCMLDVVNACMERGQKVIITTDMYLDRTTIERLLQHIGVRYDALFLSSEEVTTKLSGKLFEIVLKRMELKPSELCHIGDNPKSDLEMPEKYGIKSLERLIEKNSLPLYHERSAVLSADVLHTFIRNHMQLQDAAERSEARIGYSVLGPFLYSLCKWIHDMAEKEVNQIAFVAREGYLIQQAYGIMYHDEKYLTKYIRLNKNILRLPGLYLNPTVEQFIASVPYRNSYSMSDIAELLFLENKAEWKSALESNGFDTERHWKREELRSSEFLSMFETIMALEQSSLERQYRLLIRYLIQNDMVGKPVYLVNNSMNGSAQKVLQEILKKENLEDQMIGVQFLATKKCREDLKQLRVWFDIIPSMGRYEKELFTQYAIVLEHLLFEESGTAEYLYEKEDGSVTAKCAEIGAEQENHRVLSAIQRYALQFVRDYKENGLLELDVTCTALADFVEFLLHPYTEDACLIGNMMDSDYNGISTICNREKYVGKSYWKIRRDLKDYDKVKWAHGLLASLENGMRWNRWYDMERRVKNRIKMMVQK